MSPQHHEARNHPERRVIPESGLAPTLFPLAHGRDGCGFKFTRRGTGGVRIAHAKGVVAHSDGDVVIHALCDAILGALGDGDIGRHFPDSDPRYRGADSRVFLRVVAARMRAAGLKLNNADITVLAEAPRIAAHRDAMAANLSAEIGSTEGIVKVLGDCHLEGKYGFMGITRKPSMMASMALLFRSLKSM